MYNSMALRFVVVLLRFVAVFATENKRSTPDERTSARSEALLQTSKRVQVSPRKDTGLDEKAKPIAPLRQHTSEGSWLEAFYGAEGYQGGPDCVPTDSVAARRKNIGLITTVVDCVKLNRTVMGEDAPLTAKGFKAVTSVCCPIDMEAWFNRLLDSMHLRICSKPHIQGLMHWFTCVPDMDFQYVLDVINNGNPCKYWVSQFEMCPILSAQCEGRHCAAPLPAEHEVPCTCLGDTDDLSEQATEVPCPCSTEDAENFTQSINSPDSAPTTFPAESWGATTPDEGVPQLPAQSQMVPQVPSQSLTPDEIVQQVPLDDNVITIDPITVVTDPIITTTATTTTTNPLNGCENDVELAFWNSTVYHSNLNRLGPHRRKRRRLLPEGIRVSNLGSFEGQDFDLLVESISDRYVTKWARYNGVKGVYGYLTMNMGTGMDLRFTIVEAGTQTPMVLPKFYFSFFDLDTANPSQVEYPRLGAEVITISGFHEYHLGPDTELEIFNTTDGKTVFRAQVFGESKDNPKDPDNMTPLQQNRAVSFDFRNIASFEASYDVLDGGLSRGREVYFAGKSELAVLACRG